MKKLYILFITSILIFVFVPFCCADMVVAQTDELESGAVNRSSLSCLNRKKSRIKSYKGNNLQLKRGKLFKEDILSGYNYFLSSESQTPTREGSLLGDCKDYIVIGSIGERPNKIALYYDVTEVPPNSFLKYISNTQELQVFPPRNDKGEEISDIKEETDEEEEVEEGTTVNIEESLKAYRAPEPVVENNSENILMEEQDEEEKPVKKERPRKKIFAMLLFAFLFTAIIEGIVALLFNFDWKFVGVLTIANLLTNPVLNWAIFYYNITSDKLVILFEFFIVLIELGILALYMRKSYLKLAIFSLVANAASYAVGAYLVNIQFWWNAINKI